MPSPTPTQLGFAQVWAIYNILKFSSWLIITAYAPINSKLHPPPSPWAFELLKIRLLKFPSSGATKPFLCKEWYIMTFSKTILKLVWVSHLFTRAKSSSTPKNLENPMGDWALALTPKENMGSCIFLPENYLARLARHLGSSFPPHPLPSI